MDTSAGQENARSEVNNLISIWNVTLHADETEIMGGDCSVSNTAAYDCRMLVFILGNSDTIDDDETKKAGHCAPGMRSGGTLSAYSSDINKKHRELRHGAEHDSIE